MPCLQTQSYCEILRVRAWAYEFWGNTIQAIIREIIQEMVWPIFKDEEPMRLSDLLKFTDIISDRAQPRTQIPHTPISRSFPSHQSSVIIVSNALLWIRKLYIIYMVGALKLFSFFSYYFPCYWFTIIVNFVKFHFYWRFIELV